MSTEDGVLCRKEERLREDSFIRFLGCGVGGKAKGAPGWGMAGGRRVSGVREMKLQHLTDQQQRDHRHLVVVQ